MKNTAQPPGKFKRKYLVNWPFQIGFVILLCLPVLLTGVFAIFMVYRSAHAVLMATLFRSHLASGEIGKILAMPMLKANLLVFSMSCLLAIAAILFIAYRSNTSIQSIESDLLNFGEKPAISKWKQRTALWSMIESDAVEKFQNRLSGFSQAASILASLENTSDWNQNADGRPNRLALIKLLKEAESECQKSLNQFHWEIS